MSQLADILNSIGPQYAFIGGFELRRAVLLIYPAGVILFVAGLLVFIEAVFQKTILKGGKSRFILWLFVKIGIVGLIVSIMYFAMGGFKFIASKF